MKIGIRAHDVAIDTVEELPKKINQQSFRATQLAIKKALVGENMEPRVLDEQLALEIKKHFELQDVEIAVLGVYLNYVTEDKKALDENYNIYKQHLGLAKQMGVKFIGTETGSIQADYGYTTRNFGDVVFKQWLLSLEKLVSWAEDSEVDLGIEGVATHIVNTPKRMKDTLDSIGSKRLKVILDPVNYLTLDNIKNQEAIIDYNFEQFSDKIQIIHAKDFFIENGRIIPAVPGAGLLNYEFLMKAIKDTPSINAMLLEDVVGEDIQKAKKYLESFI